MAAMIKKDSLFNGLFLTSMVLVFLCIYSIIYEKSAFLQDNFKQVNILPIKKKNLTRNTKTQEYSRLQQNIHFVKDIIVSKEKFQAYSDSIESIKNYDGAHTALIYFFQSLLNVEGKGKGTSRIGYYGDSMIEGDLMSMTLRTMLQNKFGGRGIGFMPITSITNFFRKNINHRFSDGWKHLNVNHSNNQVLLGLSGEVFIPDMLYPKHNVSYKSSNYQFLQDLPTTKLFYGLDTAKVKRNKLFVQNDSFLLNKEKLVNTLYISKSSKKEIELNFDFLSPMPIYGVSFESSKGVLVDNFAIRGNSGMPMTKISLNMLRDFNQEMNYDLIILQFGLNVVSGKSNFTWYKNQMQRVISHFKKAMPHTSILVVSIPDQSSKNEDGVMASSPSVIPIVEAQKEAARLSEVAYFNLYKAMGGENSMVKWVEELKYANSDYVHFNYSGAKYASTLIFEFLMNAYQEYKESLNE
tara:strand:+ start:3490 stop:4887 length:1398 start_codon:yes stop_codon:yes gene_type:complete